MTNSDLIFKVCLILLEERNSARKDLMFKERNDIDISNGFIQLASKLPFLEGIVNAFFAAGGHFLRLLFAIVYYSRI